MLLAWLSLDELFGRLFLERIHSLNLKSFRFFVGALQLRSQDLIKLFRFQVLKHFILVFFVIWL